MARNFVFERVDAVSDPLAVRVGVVEAPSLIDAVDWMERKRFAGSWDVRETSVEEAADIIARLVPTPSVN